MFIHSQILSPFLTSPSLKQYPKYLSFSANQQRCHTFSFVNLNYFDINPEHTQHCDRHTPWIVDRLPQKRTDTFSFPDCPDRTWSPFSVLWNWCIGFCSQGIEQSEREAPSAELSMDTHEPPNLSARPSLRHFGTYRDNFVFTYQRISVNTTEVEIIIKNKREKVLIVLMA
jgi:hypothetical protein